MGGADRGTYCLLIRLDRRVRLTVGRLGRLTFPPGVYVYTGSAARGLTARVARHLRKRKRRHWHIDYLLAHRSARIVAVIMVAGELLSECRLNQAVMSLARARIPGFGSSDCRSGCGSHLAYLGERWE